MLDKRGVVYFLDVGCSLIILPSQQNQDEQQDNSPAAVLVHFSSLCGVFRILSGLNRMRAFREDNFIN
jgi:hypothetical protein